MRTTSRRPGSITHPALHRVGNAGTIVWSCDTTPSVNIRILPGNEKTPVEQRIGKMHPQRYEADWALEQNATTLEPRVGQRASLILKPHRFIMYKCLRHPQDLLARQQSLVSKGTRLPKTHFTGLRRAASLPAAQTRPLGSHGRVLPTGIRNVSCPWALLLTSNFTADRHRSLFLRMLRARMLFQHALDKWCGFPGI
jgi:hypothetical protein